MWAWSFRDVFLARVDFDLRHNSFVFEESDELNFEITHEEGFPRHYCKVNITDLFVSFIFKYDDEVPIDYRFIVIIFIFF